MSFCCADAGTESSVDREENQPGEEYKGQKRVRMSCRLLARTMLNRTKQTRNVWAGKQRSKKGEKERTGTVWKKKVMQTGWHAEQKAKGKRQADKQAVEKKETYSEPRLTEKKFRIDKIVDGKGKKC
ncbi:hypothetical protein BJ508DRAFT_300457 [Ascobolus immersus RN42]|uniref:Uncharacterized protein n=1 Tax=Ascobolus immersus RN42 TaxID=1160509 RepID=A0A3N4IQT6_ASCIM|nr:hypothetical protein BJ508DRAFT_300457 [Ascobolus immersus RN42]